MEIINCQNPNKVKYFELKDYIDKIKIDSNVLQHMEDTNREFNNYMDKINMYKELDIVHLWLIQMAKELVFSNKIEKHYVKKEDILKKDLFFETFDLNHKRLHDIHNFTVQDDPTKVVDSYRQKEVRVSAICPDGKEIIYWHAPEPEDVQKFMDAFIEIYKTVDVSIINLNPFLKSALIQLLFIRIHPYIDGNGRTSRLLHSIKITESINKIYDKEYRLCPLNISGSILLNQLTYVKILDNIYFDLEHDNSEYINKWFDFILNMVDEQLYYSTGKLEKLRVNYELFKTNDKKINSMLKRILADIKDIDNVDEIIKENIKIKTMI